MVIAAVPVITAVLIIVSLGMAICTLIAVLIGGFLVLLALSLQSRGTTAVGGHKRQNSFGFDRRFLLSRCRCNRSSGSRAARGSYRGSLAASKDCAQDRSCSGSTTNLLDVGLGMRLAFDAEYLCVKRRGGMAIAHRQQGQIQYPRVAESARRMHSYHFAPNRRALGVNNVAIHYDRRGQGAVKQLPDRAFATAEVFGYSHRDPRTSWNGRGRCR